LSLPNDSTGAQIHRLFFKLNYPASFKSQSAFVVKP